MPRRFLGRVGPFVTWATDVDWNGYHRLRTSRRHRKALPALKIAAPDADPIEATRHLRPAWSRLWAPGRSQWWIAVLFMIGAALFATGSGAAAWFSPRASSWIYVVGAIFFTSAAYLQWVEALNNDVSARRKTHRSWTHGWRLFGWRPRSLGYDGSLVQLAGTLLFNVNTIDALITGLSPRAENIAVWTPDMLGSVCFLIASQFAVTEVSHRIVSFQPGNVSWWITAINMAGSIFFMISAIAAYTTPDGSLLAAGIANWGTFLGAICFLVGAYLLIPEMFEKPADAHA